MYKNMAKFNWQQNASFSRKWDAHKKCKTWVVMQIGQKIVLTFIDTYKVFWTINTDLTTGV